MTNQKFNKEVFAQLDKSSADFFPRSVNIAPQINRTAALNDLTNQGANGMRNSPNVYSNPSRRFYDPTLSNTALLLPKQLKQRNKWYRWFFDHDELVGAVLELHAELPYSAFELEMDDPFILREFEDCVDETDLISQLPSFDLEYMKIGEVFLNSVWDDEKGRWSHIFPLNPDFVNVTFSPFVNPSNSSSIELIPDDDLKSLINSTRIEDQELKRKLPADLIHRVLTGRNILLNSEDVTHIARKSNPYDARGTSIISRIFRSLIYEDKLREAQQTICDNFIYPLKLFLLGDANIGWIPSTEHQSALAQMLQQAQFDPNFSLIYHYALKVEYVTVSNHILNISKEWDEINKKKMVALGVPASFLTGEGTFATANVGLQTQLARYKAKRDAFESKLIKKNFKIMAQRNEWYTRDKKELAFNFRIKRTAAENNERLATPDIIWHRKLSLREDQNYLTFLNNIYNSNKGPVSPITLLRAMGLDATEELKRKRRGKEIENRIGEKLNVAAAGAAGAAPGAAGGMAAAAAAVKGLFKFGNKSVVAHKEIVDNFFTEEDATGSVVEERKKEAEVKHLEKLREEFTSDKVNINYILSTFRFASESEWLNNLKSPRISGDVAIAFMNLKDSLDALSKKYSSFKLLEDVDFNSVLNQYKALYSLGKDTARNLFNTDARTAATEQHNLDYSDIVIINEFTEWIQNLPNIADTNNYIRLLRSFGNSSFAYGQLKCFSEYGVKSVKLANVMSNRGVCFDIDNLLSYRCGMSCVVSPSDEIMIFMPRIEHMYYTPYDEGIKIYAEQGELYKSFSYNDFTVKNCPIEYVQDLRLVLSKLKDPISKIGSAIEFTHSITDLQEWQKDATARLEDEFKKESDKERSFIVNAHLQIEKSNKADKLMVYKSGKTIYVNDMIDAIGNKFIQAFISNLDIVTADINKNLKKFESNAKFDLSDSELAGAITANEVLEVRDDENNVQCYRVAASTSDSRLKMGQVWDLTGKSINTNKIQAADIFNKDISTYLEYPHKIDEFTKSLFDSVL